MQQRADAGLVEMLASLTWRWPFGVSEVPPRAAPLVLGPVLGVEVEFVGDLPLGHVRFGAAVTDEALMGAIP